MITGRKENVIFVSFAKQYTLDEAKELLGDEFQACMTEWTLEKLIAEADRYASDPLCDAYDAYMAIHKFRTRDQTVIPDNVVQFPTKRRNAA